MPAGTPWFSPAPARPCVVSCENQPDHARDHRPGPFPRARPGRSGGRTAAALARRPLQPTCDPGMSDRKARLRISVDPHLSAYAERLGETGQAPSVSAVFNDAVGPRSSAVGGSAGCGRRPPRGQCEATAPPYILDLTAGVAHESTATAIEDCPRLECAPKGSRRGSVPSLR